MTETKKSICNMLSGLILQVVTMMVGLIIPRLVLVHYGSETNGLLNSITQIFNYVALLEAGVGIVSTQVLYERLAKHDYSGISSCLSATVHYYRNTGLIYSAVVFLCAVIYPWIVHTEINRWEVFWIIISFGLNGTFNFFISGQYRILLEADGQKYIINTVNLTVSIFANICKAVLIIFGFSVVTMQVGYSLVALMQVLGIWFYGKSQYSWLDRMAVPDLQAVSQRYSALVHQVSGLIFGSTDMILLSVFCDFKMVSVYSTYSMITNLVSNLLAQISGSVSFKMGQLYQADKDKYLLFHHIFEIVNFIIVFTAFTVTYLYLLPFISLYTEGITDVNYLDKRLPILFVLVQLLSSGRIASGNVINYAGHFQKTQSRAVLESAINIVVSVVGIYYLGIYGALMGTIAALMYRVNDVAWYSTKKLLNISPWYTYRRWISCGILFAGISMLSKSFSFTVNNYGQLLLKAVMSGVIIFFLYTGMELILERKIIRDCKQYLKQFL